MVDRTSKLVTGELSGEHGAVASTIVGAVGIIRFARPPKNHFSTPLLERIAAALERADFEPKVRSIVLCSEGRNFCAGADLVSGREEPHRLYEQAQRIFAVRKPIVAAVQGAAIGGGLGLALAADFRVVAPSSRLAANFVKLGIHPGFAITFTLPRVVGHQQAARLLYTGQRLTGTEAHACGLADELVPEDGIVDAAMAFATAIAENAPLAVEETRATLRAGLLDDIARHTAVEAEKQLRLRETDDFAEGVAAVAERRPGNWVRK